jgi:hypothetical protein
MDKLENIVSATKITKQKCSLWNIFASVNVGYATIFSRVGPDCI